ncbi:hypothetical protein SBADM41S_01602 [Streptomyces badius]
MQSLVEHARTFTEHVAANAKDFERFADGQTPEALFVTCSDSRVVPSLITGARPGQLFELRTAATSFRPTRAGTGPPARPPPSSTRCACSRCATSSSAGTPTAARWARSSAATTSPPCPPSATGWSAPRTAAHPRQRRRPPRRGPGPRPRPARHPAGLPRGARAARRGLPRPARLVLRSAHRLRQRAPPRARHRVRPPLTALPPPTSPRSAPAGRDRTHKGSHRDFREGTQEPPRRTT